MPQLETVKLIKLSICGCGYSVLLDSIRLGTEYTVDLSSIRDGFTYRCGRCKTVHTNVRVIDADVITKLYYGLKPLPAELFGL